MRAPSLTLPLAALSLSLLALACRHRSDPPAAASATAPERDGAVEQRPPPGTRIETKAWPELGAWSATERELPGSRDLFLWERRATEIPPKAQIPLRLHRPVD
jgi:hypothetical protein